MSGGGAVFTSEKLIRFHHCDPGGIVFYPQYFVLMHEVVEDWFTHGLQCDYAQFINVSRRGIPMAHMECDFLAPSRIGERLELRLRVQRVGTSSLTIGMEGVAGEEIRFRAMFTVVLTSLANGRPQAIPPELRGPMEHYLVAK